MKPKYSRSHRADPLGCLENTDHENADFENTDLKNVVCVLVEKLHSFIKSIGKIKFKRAQNYHQAGQDRFTFIKYIELTQNFQDCGFPTLFSFDCKCSFRLQKIMYKISWNFIKSVKVIKKCWQMNMFAGDSHTIL